MPFQPAPNIVGLKLEGVVDGCLTINDLYFEISGGVIDAVNIVTITALVASWFATQYAPLVSENWTGTRVIGVDLGSQTGPTATAGLAATGGVSGEAVPNNVAACISLRTAQRGRSGHGRNYIPAIANSQVTLNTLDPGVISGFETVYLMLIGAGTFAPGWQLVVLSRQTGGAPRANGIGIPVTAAIFTKNTVSSMRSRSVGHGA